MEGAPPDAPLPSADRGSARDSTADPAGARRELGRSIGLLGLQRFAGLLLGAARTKIAASALGPAGMGVLAQALTLQELLRQAANLGTSRGFLRLVSEYRASRHRRALERLIVTATILVALTSGALTLLCIVFAAPIAAEVFGDPTQALLVQWSAVAIFAAVPGAMAGRIFNGLLDLRAFAFVTLVQPTASVLAMAILATRRGIDGAVASFALAEVVGAAVGLAMLWSRAVRPLGLELGPGGFDVAVLRRLLRYAGALMVTSLVAAASALLVRSQILRQAGAEANGFYQVAWQVGQNYLGLFGISLWNYGMPKVAAQLDRPEAIVELQNEFMRLAVLVLAPGIVVLLVTRDVWIPVLYAPSFAPASTAIAFQLSGELVAMMRQSMNITLLPRERLGFLVTQGVGYWATWAALSIVLLPRLGAVAAPFAYVVANISFLIVCFGYHRAVLGYRLEAENVRLLVATLPGFAVAVALTQHGDPLVGRVLPLALVAAWAVAHRRFLVQLRTLV